MDTRESRTSYASSRSRIARTYERISNELLQLRNEAKSLRDDELRKALENAYFEAVAARKVSELDPDKPF